MRLSRPARLAAAATAANAVSLLLVGCFSSGGAGANADSVTTACADLLAEARHLVAIGQTGDGRLDWTLDELSYRCDAEYDRFVDETAAAIAGDPGGSSAATSGPTGSIPWSDAINRVGSTQYVCGPLANSGVSGDDVFLNLGLGYPEVGRFTIVLWDVGAVEEIPSGTTLCARGTITLYQGTAQIELTDPGSVEVWE